MQTTIFSSISLPNNVAEVRTMDIRVDDVLVITFADIMVVMLTGVAVVATATDFNMPVPLEGSILSC